MIITKSYINLHAQCEINFTDFYLLEIIPRKTGATLMLLAPKYETANYSYFVLKIGMGEQIFLKFERFAGIGSFRTVYYRF